MTEVYLKPLAPASLDEPGLTNLFQETVVGLTGLPATMVRPRWQLAGVGEQPPSQPSPMTDWAAVGVTGRTIMDFPNTGYIDGQTSEVWQSSHQERLNLLASFFGPNCMSNASVLRDGLYILQNLENLYANGIKFNSAGDITEVPDIVNLQWVNRCDLPLVFVRSVDRTYAIHWLKNAPGEIYTDVGYNVSFDVGS